ncbi:MAG: AsnC family protein [Theionarchaea archaeon]|nr:AsnC family protein [Theionarchaea archaeon]
MTIAELHRKFKPYKSKRMTSNLLSRSRNESVLIGPKIWCNENYYVTLIDNSQYKLDFFDEMRNNSAITYIYELIGSHSFLIFSKGKFLQTDSIPLVFAESIIPSFPEKIPIEKLHLTEIGQLPHDQIPNEWDRLDWKIYSLMRDPFISYVKIGSLVGVSWKTIQNRYKKIIKNCKSWIAFFPRGYQNYSQTLLTFNTKYEVNLRNELKKLDRTTILYKAGDTMILNLFFDHSIQHYVFRKFEKKGLIKNLRVSIPIRWSSQSWE